MRLCVALFAAIALLANAPIALADTSAPIEIDGPPEFVQDIQAGLAMLETIHLRTYVEMYVWRIQPSSGAGWPADAGAAVEYPADRFQRAIVDVRWPPMYGQDDPILMAELNDPVTVAALLAHEATHQRLNEFDPAHRGDETATRTVQLIVLWELAGPQPLPWP
jgi:hypothetical protein